MKYLILAFIFSGCATAGIMMGEMGKSFSNNPPKTTTVNVDRAPVNCTTSVIGEMAYTNCY